MINSNNIDFSEITPQIHELAQRCVSKNAIDPTLYTKYQVNRGLRDLNGKGVLTGLTEISEIQSSMESGRADRFLRRKAVLPRREC